MEKITIYGQVPAQKNSKQIAYNPRTRKPFIMTNSRVKEWQMSASVDLLKASFVAGPVEINMKFWNIDARKRDVDNMIISILDLLKNNGVIEDDNCFIVRKVSGEFAGVDKANPRAEICVKAFDII